MTEIRHREISEIAIYNISEVLSLMSQNRIIIDNIDTPEKYIDTFVKAYHHNRDFRIAFHDNFMKDYHNWVGAAISGASSLISSIGGGLLGASSKKEQAKAQADAIKEQMGAQTAMWYIDYLSKKSNNEAKTEGKILEGQSLIYFIAGLVVIGIVATGLILVLRSSRRKKRMSS
jgi:hypothetical protein